MAEDTLADLFAISTAEAPVRTFTVDGTEYELKDVRHLSPIQEARAHALARQESRIIEQIDQALDENNMDLAEGLGLKLRDLRMQLIQLMTTAPLDVIQQIKYPDQVTIVTAIRRVPIRNR